MSGRDLSPVLDWRGAIAASDLSMAQKGVAHALANYMNSRGGSAFPALMTLAGDASCAKSTVVESLRVLEERGFLTKTVGGGRGRRSSYQALIPRETVARQDPSSAASERAEMPGDASSGPLTADGRESRAGTPDRTETVRLADSFRVGDSVVLAGVNGRRSGRNGRPGGHEVDHEVDQDVDHAAAAAADLEHLARRLNDETRAAILLHGLDELRVPTRVRQAALLDPDRAIAWLELTRSEAYSNPGGFFVAGLMETNGAWPSVRGALAGPGEFDKCRGWIEKTGVRLQAEDGHFHIDDWLGLGDLERQELHETLDAAIAARDTTAAAEAAA